MARAALLNLKGTQYQAIPSPTLSDGVLGSFSGTSSPNLGLAFNQLGLGHINNHRPSLSIASPLPHQDTYSREAPDRQVLSALGVNAATLEGLNSQAAHISAPGLRLGQHVAGGVTEPFDDHSELQLALMGMQGLSTRAQNGYTPVEQLILQAHARQQRETDVAQSRLHSSHAGAAIGPRIAGVRSTANSRSLLDFLPQISEDDFHATAGSLRNLRRLPHPPNVDAETHSRAGGGQSYTQSLGLDRQQSVARQQQSRQRNHTLATQGRSGTDTRGVHIRSSTLPSQYLGSRDSQSIDHAPLYDSNISLGSNIPVSNNNFRTSNSTHTTKNKHGPFVVTNNLPPSRNIDTISKPSTTTLPDTQTLFSSKNNINVPSAALRMRASGPVGPSTNTANKPGSTVTGGASLIRPAAMRAPAYEGEDGDENSPVVSPALTYSTRTPASLSPATPYSGFFTDGAETFKDAGVAMTGSVNEGRVDVRGKALEGGNL